MRRIIIFTLLMLGSFNLFAQAKLDKLVQEREAMHRQWQSSESRKTGIFGNRTKKDMIETHNWMERIIQKDNQIIEELKLLSEIEKTEITYEKNDYKFISQKQEREIAQLKRALSDTKDIESEKRSERRTFEWMSLIFFLSTITVSYLYYKKLSVK
jgi:ribosome-binding ATPase YchF (GTP1/OBG family)